MTNKFIDELKSESNFGYTENGAVKRTTTGQALLDLFAMGAAYRTRSTEDCIFLFKKAYEENPEYAMKCLFYIRDILEGQGERRFFRDCMRWLAGNQYSVAERNIPYIPQFGRWDDLIYIYIKTHFESKAFDFIKNQLMLDLDSKTPSLLGKWMPSENASSVTTKEAARILRKYLKLTSREYRKMLSILRKRINVLERLMSSNQWDKIEFDKIPSRAGMIYRNAFARHDIEREKTKAMTYAEFAKSSDTKVNAKALYPYECVAEARKIYYAPTLDTQRLMVNKYWDNLNDYFNSTAKLDAMAVVDVSGSMCGSNAAAPINVAISLGMYCAQHVHGPYHNKFMTFSSNPQFVEVEGIDFVDKVTRMSRADWGGSTNIEACFDKMLDVAIRNGLKQNDIPAKLIIISDMEFDQCVTSNKSTYDRWGYGSSLKGAAKETLFESMKNKWATHGYKLPQLIFWNVEARSDNIPMRDDGNVCYVSGMSPSIFQQVIEGKSATDLMFDKLNSDRYRAIH